MTKIFADSHHSSLTSSLKYLFVDRLHYELRFPTGMEWWYEGLWAVFPSEITAKQYLERDVEGVNGISLEEFKNTKFDVLLCSIPQHVPIWLKLQELYQPQSKIIMQIGNTWPVEAGLIKNIMAAARLNHPTNINYVEYHEEFDLDIFKPEVVKTDSKNIYNFVNCLGAVDIYKEDWELFLELEKLLPDWNFKSYGGQNRDGWCNGPQEVADKIREATYIFNCKKFGDGFGFTIHEAAAVGRPLITRFSDYKGKLAEPLIDETTSIMVDNATPETIANIIRTSWETETYTPIIRGKNIYDKFTKHVDFEAEEKLIKNFLEKLL